MGRSAMRGSRTRAASLLVIAVSTLVQPGCARLARTSRAAALPVIAQQPAPADDDRASGAGSGRSDDDRASGAGSGRSDDDRASGADSRRSDDDRASGAGSGRSDKKKNKPAANPLVEALVKAHNRERAAEDLPPLALNPELQAAAEAHARDMAKHQTMSHEGSDGSEPAERVERAGYHYQETGENVAQGQKSVPEVMQSWMNSRGHRKNILGRYSEIGVARARSKDGQSFWCAVFGRPWPSLDPDKAAQALVDALNREREKAGKAPVRLNEDVQAAAQSYAGDMAAQDTLALKDGDGMGPTDRIQETGYPLERLAAQAASSTATADETLESWISREKSKSALMGDYRDAGVGYATSDEGIPYWCLFLTRPARSR